MKVSKQVNWIWQQWNDSPEETRGKYENLPFFGKWQYIYENEKGKIGVQEVNNMGVNGVSVWTIEILDAVDERLPSLTLPTQEMAQATAYEMLGEKMDDKKD